MPLGFSLHSLRAPCVCVFSGLKDRKADAESKKKGSMRIINIMFDVYFRLKNYRLCAPLTKILEGPGYPPLTAYPPSHVVTYRFYTGRLSLFNGDYDAAQRDLSLCFHACPRTAFKNKRLALVFLVPAALMLGKLPLPRLLAKYQLAEYSDITVAVQRGDLALFNRAFAQHETVFRRRGLYLLLERLKWHVYRKLLKVGVVLSSSVQIAFLFADVCAAAHVRAGAHPRRGARLSRGRVAVRAACVRRCDGDGRGGVHFGQPDSSRLCSRVHGCQEGQGDGQTRRLSFSHPFGTQTFIVFSQKEPFPAIAK